MRLRGSGTVQAAVATLPVLVPTRSTVSAARTISFATRPRPDGPAGVGADHARAERVRLVDRALAERRRCHRRAEEVGHLAQLVTGPGDEHAPAGDDGDPAGLGENRHRLPDGRRVRRDPEARVAAGARRAGLGAEAQPVSTSSGQLTSAGPGRPLVASANARVVSSATRSGRSSRTAHFVTGRNSARWSTSWIGLRPTSAVLTSLTIATTGVDDAHASAIPVMRFVAPGPRIAVQTPGRPLTRA